MEEGMDSRLRAIERKLGIDAERDADLRIVRFAEELGRLNRRLDRIERTINGGGGSNLDNSVGVQAMVNEKMSERIR